MQKRAICYMGLIRNHPLVMYQTVDAALEHQLCINLRAIVAGAAGRFSPP